MRQVHYPVTVTYAGKLYRLAPHQWRELAPQVKGLRMREAAVVAERFLRREGLINPNPCSWCQAERGDKPRKGQSHGICRKHFMEMMEECQNGN